MRHVHTFFVPDGQEPIEQWKELCIFGRRVSGGDTGTWANISCDGEECAGIESSVDA